jgi:hypothetical protein
MSADRDRDRLDGELRRLAASIETPTPTDYPERVRRALAAAAPSPAPRARRSLRRGALRRVAVAATAVVALVAVALAVPTSRHALASWFGFPGIEISRGHGQPPPPPRSTVSPSLVGAGTRVSLFTAQRAMGRSLRLPAALASPTNVLLDRDNRAVVVTIAYRSAFGLRPTPHTGYALVVTEIGFAGQPLFEKILQPGASASAVTVAGAHPGAFIAGPQAILSLDPSRTDNGQPTLHAIAPRTSANTLIWNDGTVTFRIEGDFRQQEALGIADRFR